MKFFDETDINNEVERLTKKVNKIFNLNQRGTFTINDNLDKTNLNVDYNLASYTVRFTANYATNDEGIRGIVKLVPKIEISYVNFYFDENLLINGSVYKFESELIEKLRNRFRNFGILINYPPALIKSKSTQSSKSDVDESLVGEGDKPESYNEELEADKSRLRKKVEKIYDAFKKFNTIIERSEIKFKFTIILPPVATVNFSAVGKINDMGLYVYDDDGEIVVDKLQPYLIIPRFYIIYDEEMIENLEWSQKPDFMWLESKIKDKIIKNFKNFKIDVSHFGKAVWRTFEKTNLDDTSDLWNPNFKSGILSEE